VVYERKFSLSDPRIRRYVLFPFLRSSLPLEVILSFSTFITQAPPIFLISRLIPLLSPRTVWRSSFWGGATPPCFRLPSIRPSSALIHRTAEAKFGNQSCSCEFQHPFPLASFSFHRSACLKPICPLISSRFPRIHQTS